MTLDHFWMFALAALMLNLTPGNDMLYVMARSASQGSRAGIVSALGIMAGCLVHILAAVAGLSAVIASSALLFAIIKYTGALYLVYLGLRSVLAKQEALAIAPQIQNRPYGRIFWQGVLTNVLNPKVALFFLAFLPPFIQTGSGQVTMQILLLGLWFNLGGTVVNVAVALLFGKMGKWFGESAGFVKWLKTISGGILIALGIRVALSSRQ